MINARYKLPTRKQILFSWDVKPTAKVVGIIIQDWADEEMEEMSDKAYNHMPQAEREEFDRDQLKKAKITVSIRKLAEISNASRGGVNAALDELQEKGFVESNRPKKGKGANERKEYYFRLYDPDIRVRPCIFNANQNVVLSGKTKAISSGIFKSAGV